MEENQVVFDGKYLYQRVSFFFFFFLGGGGGYVLHEERVAFKVLLWRYLIFVSMETIKVDIFRAGTGAI